MNENNYTGTRLKGKTWSYRFSIVIKGQKVIKEKSGFKSSYEAYKAREKAKAQFMIDEFIDKNVSLDIVFDFFIKGDALISKSYNTILRYNSIYKNHIQPTFGKSKITKIQPIELQDFIDDKSKEYTSDYPRSLYNFFLVLFKFAFMKEYILHNPMEKVVPPRQYGNKKDKNIQTEVLLTLQERLKTTNVQVPFNIALGLGLRASETYALRYSDFDFKKNEVVIHNQLQSQNGIWCLVPLKTQNSKRTIRYGQNFSDYLQSIIALQKQERLKLGNFYCANQVIDKNTKAEKEIFVNDFICVKSNGEMITPNSNKVIARIAKDLGIEFNFHLLRHKYCSTLAEYGSNPKTIKENVGHGNFAFTFDRYVHPSDQEKDFAGQIIDNEMKFEAVRFTR